MIRPRLMGLAGVANVAIWGERDRQLQVLVDPRRLRADDVTLSQIVDTTGNAQLTSPLTFLNASTPGTGGFIDGPNQRLSITHVLPLSRPGDLARVPLAGSDGLRLGEVATVSCSWSRSGPARALSTSPARSRARSPTCTAASRASGSIRASSARRRSSMPASIT
jgi:multidrug efflux pump subunit AcrB